MRLISVRIAGLKNQHAEYQLAPLTVFTGPNGAGKTSVLQAVRFGLLGFEPSLGRSAEKLAPLMGANEMSVRLTAERSEGGKLSVTRSLTLKDGKLSSGITVVPSDGEQKMDALKARAAAEFGSFLAMLDLGDFLELSHDKRRAFLFGLAAQACELTAQKVLDLTWAAMEPGRKDMPKEVWDRAVEIILELKQKAEQKGASAAHEIIDLMIAGLKVTESETTADRRNHTAAVQSLTEEMGTLSTVAANRAALEAEVKALNGQVDVATRETEQARSALQAWQRARDRQAEITKQREALPIEPVLDLVRTALTDVQAKILASDGDLERLRRNLEVFRADLLTAQQAREQAALALRTHDAGVEAVQALLDKIGHCGEEGKGHCILGRKRGDLQHEKEGRDQLTQALAAADDEAKSMDRIVQEATNKIAVENLANRTLCTEATAAARKLSGLEMAAGQRTATLEALRKEEGSLTPILDAAPATDVDVLEARSTSLKHKRDTAQGQAVAVARREAIERALADAQASRAKAEIDGESLKVVKVALGPKGLQGEVARLVIEPMVGAANGVLGGLPAGKRLFIRTVSAKGDEVTDVGWQRGNALIRFETLSGGEKIQFGAAIAAGLLSLKNPPLRVLTIDDLQSVDAENRLPFLMSLLKLLKDGKLDNVLVASNTPVPLTDTDVVRIHQLAGQPAMAEA